MNCIVQVDRGGAGLPHLAPALDGALPEGGLPAGPPQHQRGRAVQVNSMIFGIYIFVCEADLEILMLCVRPSVREHVEMT